MAENVDSVLSPRDAAAPWTAAEAAHLLARAQFGLSPAELDRSVKEGLPATVERLLQPQPESAEFQTAEAALREAALATSAIDELKIWWLYRMRFSANPLVEKMTLLWHNHFATSNAKVNHVPRMTRQNDLIRQLALGDFRELLHGMARDPAMLIWLDGNANRKRHPNENFAREVMELFSLGIGNYTEKDIQEAARAFTGWHVREGEFWFNTLQHDPGDKTVFGKTSQFDGNAIIDLCLAQPACPRFLALKLLRTFVVATPAPRQIDAVAASITRHHYRMQPVLGELFRSQMFFAPEHRRSLIKSPLDFVLGSLRGLGGSVNWPPVVQLLADLGQNVFEPPSVKGWDGGRLWINTSTLLMRANFVTGLCFSEKFGKPDFHAWLATPGGPDHLLQRGLDVFLGGDADDGRLAAELKSLWDRSEGDPSQHLRTLVSTMMTLPEYQLG
jgi:uncharacterized protein (DUF1800 family)